MDSDLRTFCLRSAYCFLTESFTISYDSLSHYHGENPKNLIFNMMFHDVFIPRMLHFNSFFVCRIPLERQKEKSWSRWAQRIRCPARHRFIWRSQCQPGRPVKNAGIMAVLQRKKIDIIYTRVTLIIFTHSHIHTINYNFSLQSSWKYHAFMIWTG